MEQQEPFTKTFWFHWFTMSMKQLELPALTLVVLLVLIYVTLLLDQQSV